MSKSYRALTTLCAKIAHAHLSFGRLIAESARKGAHQYRPNMKGCVSHRIETRHCRCSITLRM